MTTDSGAPGAPRFDVVLRGYDRRQVDEHVARLQRVIARMRADLSARTQEETLAREQPAARPLPAGLDLPPAADGSDKIGTFTDRMQRILQTAEEEAEEIRGQARAAASAEVESTKAQLDDVVQQRDAMLAEMAQVRSQLEGLLSAQTARLSLSELAAPPPSGAGAATAPVERPARPSPRPRPRPDLPAASDPTPRDPAPPAPPAVGAAGSGPGTPSGAMPSGAGPAAGEDVGSRSGASSADGPDDVEATVAVPAVRSPTDGSERSPNGTNPPTSSSRSG